jgi:hypothetical protein
MVKQLRSPFISSLSFNNVAKAKVLRIPQHKEAIHPYLFLVKFHDTSTRYPQEVNITLQHQISLVNHRYLYVPHKIYGHVFP